MKKIFVLLVVMVMIFSGCQDAGLPDEPGEPGTTTQGDAKTGQAIGLLDSNVYASAGSNIVLSASILDFSASDSLNLDITAKNKDYVWKKFHIMGVDANGDGIWKEYLFDTSTANANTGWIVVDNSAEGISTTLTINKNDLPSSDNYVVIYTCNKVSSGFDCNNGKWTYKPINIKTTDLMVDSVAVDSSVTPVPTKDSETKVDVVVKNSNAGAKFTANTIKLKIDFDVGDGAAISKVRMGGNDLDVVNGIVHLDIPISEFSTGTLTKSFNVIFTKNRNYQIRATIDLAESGKANGEVIETDESNNFLTTGNIYIGAATDGSGDAVDFTVETAEVVGEANVNEITTVAVTYKRMGGGSSYDVSLPTAVDFHTGTGNSIENVKVDNVELGYTGGKYLYNLIFGNVMEKTLNYEVTYTTARTYGVKAWVNYGSDVTEANIGNNDKAFASLVTVGHGLPDEVDDLS